MLSTPNNSAEEKLKVDASVVPLNEFARVPKSGTDQSTQWLFQIINPTENDISGDSILESLYESLVVAQFKTDKNVPYLEGVVYFHKRRGFSSMPRVHKHAKWFLLARKTSLISAVDYCLLKGSNPLEKGVKFSSRRISSSSSSRKIESEKPQVDPLLKQKEIFERAFSKETWIEAAEILSNELPLLFYANADGYKKSFLQRKEMRNLSVESSQVQHSVSKDIIK